MCCFWSRRGRRRGRWVERDIDRLTVDERSHRYTLSWTHRSCTTLCTHCMYHISRRWPLFTTSNHLLSPTTSSKRTTTNSLSTFEHHNDDLTATNTQHSACTHERDKLRSSVRSEVPRNCKYHILFSTHFSLTKDVRFRFATYYDRKRYPKRRAKQR